MKNITGLFSVVIAILFYGCESHPVTTLQIPQAEQWGVFEVTLKGPATGNPYMDVDLSAVFSNNEKQITVPGFYDGDSTYRIRFSPPETGTWNYVTESNAEELAGQEGGFICTSPSDDNHGPLRIVNQFYFEYSDGTPFYVTGTTAYQWVSVDKDIQEKTLQTLESSPFNKVRMTVFPKYYQYGNETEPWIHPFKREDGSSDFTQPEFEYFQNLDRRIRQLRNMGIQADVILFHPYDSWGYSRMGKEMNEKYVRYMIARLSAYRNVWWSLANEWDVPSIKDEIDWEGIGTILQEEDPHQRFRGIHNWENAEDNFYDHTRPWITHVSTQSTEFFNAQDWREQYQKPLLFDEMRYEGDVERGWGNLTPEQMTSFFWMAGLSGGYPTHGDTYENDADNDTEVRWWAKGGTLPGESPERIAFFKSVMEHAPVKEMEPELVGNNPKSLNSNVYIFSKPGTYYMAYTSTEHRNFELELEGDAPYKLEVLDTWNMEVIEEREVQPGPFRYEPENPFTAIRLYHEQLTTN
jgi:hypothetical protein